MGNINVNSKCSNKLITASPNPIASSNEHQNANASSTNAANTNNSTITTIANTNTNLYSRNKTKILIPYDRWIKYDCKKWGHFKEFDYFNGSATSETKTNFNSITSFTSTTLTNYDLNFPYNLYSNYQTNLSLINHVNGCFFKPIERLGDSQFIISQFKPNSNIIVTVPCSIARYHKQNNEMLLRLNRVIGVCEKFLVFQIWKGNNECEIFIYDFDKSKANCIVKKLNRPFNRRVYTCLISPSRNVILITPDYEDNHLSSSYNTYYHSYCDELTLIINLDTLELLRSIPARCDQRFAFDPRYSEPRFAEFDTVRGQIIDLNSDKLIVCSNHTLKTKVFRVEYTRDGYLIIVVCTLPIFQKRLSRRNYFILILNSSTLLHMHSIIDYRGPLLNTYTFSNDFNLLFNIYPSLSNCASSIAVLKNIEPSTNTRFIELHLLPNVCSMSLKELCRRTILRCVDSKLLHKLPLPPKLISYLSFNNYNSYDIYNGNNINNNNQTNSTTKNNMNLVRQHNNLKFKLKKKVKKNKFCFIFNNNS